MLLGSQVGRRHGENAGGRATGGASEEELSGRVQTGQEVEHIDVWMIEGQGDTAQQLGE